MARSCVIPISSVIAIQVRLIPDFILSKTRFTAKKSSFPPAVTDGIYIQSVGAVTVSKSYFPGTSFSINITILLTGGIFAPIDVKP